jgi:hypothetical protein
VEYAGYEEFGDETHYELYKVDEYPEELEDLIKSHPGVADDL